MITEHEEIQRVRSALEQQSEHLRRECDQLEGEQQEVAVRWETWRRSWSDAAEALPLAARQSPDHALDCLDLLAEAARDQELVRERRERLAKMDAFLQRFEATMRKLAKEPAVRALGLQGEPGRQAAQLLTAWDRLQHEQRQRRTLLQELDDKQRELQAASTQEQRLASQLEAMCGEAGCATIEQLQQAEVQSETRREAERLYRSLREQLLNLAEGEETVEQLTALAQTQAPEDLDRQGAAIDRQLNQSKSDLDALDAEWLAVEKELHSMEGPGQAAAEAEAANDVLVELGEMTAMYARLKTVQVLLQEGLEDYRQRQQGPLLARCGELFRTLTCGAFRGVKVEVAESGAAALAGLRGGQDDLVPVQGMSDGTADQLYLALRLAWIEHYLDNHESLPVVVDDLLIQFDDQRSARTLEVLSQLAGKTQVLFFTHHLHLLELAERRIGGRFQEHRLPTLDGDVADAGAAPPSNQPRGEKSAAARR